MLLKCRMLCREFNSRGVLKPAEQLYILEESEMYFTAGAVLLGSALMLLWFSRPVNGEVRGWVSSDRAQTAVGMYSCTALILGAILLVAS